MRTPRNPNKYNDESALLIKNTIPPMQTDKRPYSYTCTRA